MAVQQTIVIRNSYINYPGVAINEDNAARNWNFSSFLSSREEPGRNKIF